MKELLKDYDGPFTVIEYTSFSDRIGLSYQQAFTEAWEELKRNKVTNGG